MLNSSHVFVHEVQATVTGHEAGYLLAVLNELHTHTLTDSGVRLLCLQTTVILISRLWK